MGEGWHRGSGSAGRRVPWRPWGTGSAQWGSRLAPGALGVLGGHPGAVSCTHKGVPGDEIEECHLLNGTEKVRFVERFIYNREQFLILDSDVGVYVGFIAYGEMNAKRSNRHPVHMEYYRALVDTQCWRNYELYAPFTTVERRGCWPDGSGMSAKWCLQVCSLDQDWFPTEPILKQWVPLTAEIALSCFGTWAVHTCFQYTYSLLS
ncbi:rano class II histocompatibility antigen, D-1 beta chain-like isoform X1 [Haemorhous mexicanus]|uniref:rano class II histocompatibility antigen, D-1 beta chain-like isoform X1 n=1 Tax=Haemorhous mexicanus TaxID=30427 RepID=UPI0028BE1E91|nr:rano class II histocompatibility antigen, D-1 beta chain-like isoform X1 [Haemorhous mexicanus]